MGNVGNDILHIYITAAAAAICSIYITYKLLHKLENGAGAGAQQLIKYYRLLLLCS
jgi:hypothetical protein